MRTTIAGQGLPASPKASPALHGGPILPMAELQFGVDNSEEDSAGHKRLSTEQMTLPFNKSSLGPPLWCPGDGRLVKTGQEG